jgi:hypothetical protein
LEKVRHGMERAEKEGSISQALDDVDEIAAYIQNSVQTSNSSLSASSIDPPPPALSQEAAL